MYSMRLLALAAVLAVGCTDQAVVGPEADRTGPSSDDGASNGPGLTVMT